MAIADTGKAGNQPLSPDAYQAQQAEIARLSQAVQLAEVENQGLRARVAELEAQTAWRTIESAPLFDDSGETRVIVFGGRHKKPVAITPDGEWWRIEAARGSKAVPTHWMPMPDNPETPQKPPICLQEPPVVVSGGDSPIELYKMPEWAEGFAVGETGVRLPDKPEGQGVRQRSAFRDGFYTGRRRFLERNP